MFSVLLAVSGGLDSMCMLRLFAGKKGEYSNIYAAYVNHGARPCAEEDARLVKRACEECAIPFFELFIDSKIFAESGKGGFEAIARRARYDLLFALKRRLGADLLATAHHRDDQAETVFLRMARGAGLKGLRGILPEREDGVMRPMLGFSKSDLLEYARRSGVEWREDPTNADGKHFRNLARLRFLPGLERECPGAIGRLARVAELAQRAYPKAMGVLDASFNPFLVARSDGAALLRHFYLPAAPGYGELFRLWLGGNGISWEETNEDSKLYEKLRKKDSFRFRLGKAYFERKKGFLLCVALGNR